MSGKSQRVRKKTKSDPKVKRNDATATAIHYAKQLIENDNLFTTSDSYGIVSNLSNKLDGSEDRSDTPPSSNSRVQALTL